MEFRHFGGFSSIFKEKNLILTRIIMFNLTSKRIEILQLLLEQSQMTNTEVADEKGVAPSTTYVQLKILKKHNLIKKKEIEWGVIVYSLTEQGQKELKKNARI